MAHHAGVLSRRLLVALVLVLPGVADAAPTASYALKYSADDTTIQVALCLAQAASSVRFAGDEHAPLYLDAIRRDSGAALSKQGDAWIARDWRPGECLHYRAALGRIAAADRWQRRKRADSALLVDPQT
ncbi:MAG: hypothetical protein ACHP7D_07300, partial [Lysobacterales bacterium]